MGVRTWMDSWPVIRQLTGPDPLGRGAAAQSPHSKALEPRTATADRVAHSVCPYCAVGCGQRVFVKDEKVIQIEGDPDSPDLPRPAVPEGLGEQAAGHRPAAARPTVLYRAPVRAPSGRSSTSTRAMDMVADRVLDARGTRLAGHRRRRQPACAARWASRASAGRRWTTRRTTSSRSCSPRWAPSRSRTRPVFDTPPPSPVWGPPSVAAAPRTTSRTSPTPTASSSRARTWPRPIRSGSSG